MLNGNITGISIVFMVIFSILELWSYRKGKEFKDYKSVIVSIGVLGTFIGIFLGLMDFNTKDIQSSIPTLLDGLKVAFLTSIAGMGLSIILSAIEIQVGKKESDKDANDFSKFSDKIQDLLDIFGSITSDIKDKEHSLQKLVLLEHIPEIKNAIEKQTQVMHENLVLLNNRLIALETLPKINEKLKEHSNSLEKLALLDELPKIHQSNEKQIEYLKNVPNIQNLLEVQNETRLLSLDALAKIDEDLHKLSLLDELPKITIFQEKQLGYLIDVPFIKTELETLNEQSKIEFTLFHQHLESLNNIDSSIMKVSEKILNMKEDMNKNNLLMRTLLQEKLIDIINSLEKAVETLSRGATEEIIKALEQVIVDFNSNLTEQFGESFKKLNEAVFSLVLWQENYKEQIVDFENKLKATLQTVELSNITTVELFKEESNTVSNFFKTQSQETTNSFGETIKIMKDSLMDASEVVKSSNIATVELFKEESNTVSNFFKTQSQETTNSFGETIKIMKDSLIDASEVVKSSNIATVELFKEESNTVSNFFKTESKTVLNSFEKLTVSTQYIEAITAKYETISKVSKELEEIIKTNNSQILDFTEHTKSLAKIGEDARLITNEMKSFSEIIIGSLSNQSDQLAKQSKSVSLMMDEIEAKLPKSLEILNKNLTGLSEKFTENYKILLNSLLARND